MEREDWSRVNREAWNEAEPIHARRRFQRSLEMFRRPGFSCLRPVTRQRLLEHGLRGRAVFQPCCHDGRHILSIKNLGACRCVGFDLSDRFVAQGRQLAAASGIECELVRADVYRLGEAYDGQFDIAYIAAGTHPWLPDLGGFFAAIRRLLRPGAWLFMQDMHPILNMFSMEASKRPRRWRSSYFMGGVHRSTGGLDYYAARRYRARPAGCFHHKLSDIVQAVVESGLELESLEEGADDVSGGWARHLARRKLRLHLSFTLTATAP